MHNITISDIAREAGVSKATVSRVLNNNTIVEASTRDRVQQVIDKYHYKPSQLARSMSTQKSSTIGILIPEIDNAFFGSLIRGVLHELEDSGYTLVCFNSDEDPNKDIKAIQDMISYKYSGLLYTPVQDYYRIPERKEIEKLLKEFDAPVVLMDRNFAELKQYNSVYFDDRNAIREAVGKLAQAGHRKIGLINPVPVHFLAEIRYEGYRLGLEENGIAFREDYNYVISGYNREEAYQKSLEMLKSPDRPTAVITGNNTITLGLLKALSDCGMSIPKDIDGIMLDQIEALDLIGFGLNYIERDGARLGKTAARILLDHIEQPTLEKQSIAMDYRIVIRN